MNIKIASIELTSNERLYGSLIKDLEKAGYIVTQDDVLRNKCIIARKEDKE